MCRADGDLGLSPLLSRREQCHSRGGTQRLARSPRSKSGDSVNQAGVLCYHTQLSWDSCLDAGGDRHRHCHWRTMGKQWQGPRLSYRQLRGRPRRFRDPKDPRSALLAVGATYKARLQVVKPEIALGLPFRVYAALSCR